MENLKRVNWFFVIIAFVIGIRLFKHVDFKDLTLQKPILDILYLIVFVAAIIMMFKDFKKAK
jgi:nicotinamide riboside transporter PnuC